MEPINLLENKQEDFELFGQCGVRMKVNASYSGMWSIDAVMSEFVFYYISFSLDVQQIKQQNPDKMVSSKFFFMILSSYRDLISRCHFISSM